MNNAFAALIIAVLAAPSFAAQNGAVEQLLSLSGGDKPAVNLAKLPPEPPFYLAAPGNGAETGKERFFATITAKDKYQRTLLVDSGFDIIETGDGKASGFATEEMLRAVENKGMKIEEKIPFSDFNDKFMRDFPPADAAYHNYQEMYSAIKAIETKLPEYASVFSIGQSVEGKEIWALRFCKNDGAQKPGVLYMGNHHAREHLSAEVALAYAEWLAGNKDSADVKKMLDTRDIYIIPMVNPDGAEYDIKGGKYAWWRKNRARNSDKSYGVDLNRNYGYKWGGAGASANPSADTYMGPAGFSEPETRAIRDFISTHLNITIFLSYHTYSKLILYPWGYTYGPIADAKDMDTFVELARKMASFTGYTPQQASDLYLTTGDTMDWAYGEHKIFGFTIELDPDRWGYGGFYPDAEIIPKVVSINMPAAFYLTRMADNPRKVLGNK